jgi:hypothetical protein
MSTISIEIAYAEAEHQWLIPAQVPEACRVGDAIRLSSIEQIIPSLTVDEENVGIFGQRCDFSTTLQDGDRIELYRPLLIDPREKRRERAARAKAP